MKKPLQLTKFFFVAVYFALVIHSASGQMLSARPLVSVQDIVKRWTVLEGSLAELRLRDAVDPADLSALLDAAAAFYSTARAFRDSETYRIYRLIPLNETGEPPDIAGLAETFCEALKSGDLEKTRLLSTEINSALIKVLTWDGEVARFSGGSYFRLLMVFLVFIVLIAAAVWFLYRALTRSLRREAEGSAFSQAVLLAQEEERARLSRELHDTIAQDLRYLSLGMEKIGRTEDALEREKLCGEAAASQSGLIRRVRDICDYLVPPDFRFQGLPDALRQLCFDFGKRTGIDCRIDIKENVSLDFLNGEKQLQAYRIVQEALINIEKHAEATEAIVIMRSDPQGLYIGVSDDGKGFEPLPGNALYQRQDRTAPHLGIRGMNERAAILGGSLTIKSESGEGTLVCLELPVDNVE